MWTFTTIGFFSTVSHPTQPDMVMVRARCEEHIANFCLEAKKVAGIEPQVLKQPQSDYLWRVIVPKDDMVAVFANLLHNVDYNNFKTECSRTSSGSPASMRYMSALNRVWNEMYQVQELEEMRRVGPAWSHLK